jgi:hypothetical protein
MRWEEEHKQRVSQFPKQIREAHAHSSNHRSEVETSDICGCFYCCALFTSSEIKDWIDEDKEGIGQTALCPRCGIDSVIGSKAGFPIKTDFLDQMKNHWF